MSYEQKMARFIQDRDDLKYTQALRKVREARDELELEEGEGYWTALAKVLGIRWPLR